MWVCRLPVHIDPARRIDFYGNLRRIRNFAIGSQSRRPLQKAFDAPHSVGADDSVRPQTAPFFTEICSKFGASQRADVGIGPYRVLRKFLPSHFQCPHPLRIGESLLCALPVGQKTVF